jgi:hypothetical protein
LFDERHGTVGAAGMRHDLYDCVAQSLIQRDVARKRLPNPAYAYDSANRPVTTTLPNNVRQVGANVICTC